MTESLAAAEGGAAPGDWWDPLDPGSSSPVVAWLASEESGWLTGQVLRVSGNTMWRMAPWSVDERGYRSRSGERLDAAEVGAAVRGLYGTMPLGVAAALAPRL